MRKKSGLKRALAVWLAAALVFTGPVSSGAYVQAAEVQEDAGTAGLKDAGTQDVQEAATEEEKQVVSNEETVVDEETTEAVTEAVVDEEITEAEGTTKEEAAAEMNTVAEVFENGETASETTLPEETAEEAPEETAAEDEDLTTKYGAPLLTLGTNEGYFLKKGDENTRYFAFTAEESGVYSVKIAVSDGLRFDAWFKRRPG